MMERVYIHDVLPDGGDTSALLASMLDDLNRCCLAGGWQGVTLVSGGYSAKTRVVGLCATSGEHPATLADALAVLKTARQVAA